MFSIEKSPWHHDFWSNQLHSSAYSLKLYSIKCFKPICFYLEAFFDWSVHYKVKMFALDFLDSDWWLLSWAEKLVPVLDGTYSAELILSVLGQLYKPQFSFLVRMPKCCLKSMIFASNQLAPMAYSLKFYSKKVSCQYVFI